jgi:phenylpropionate dioxygenase-like ring-hydroxylating dioxygenase large terminal subunit
MDSIIGPFYYYSPEIFQKEKDNLFLKGWNFIGFKDQLVENNDFITLDFWGLPIVIQNLNGSIKAFLNICSHRFCIIQKDSKGNRPLLCPYHGWSYNSFGIPSGIPKRPLFSDYSKEDLQKLKLKEYQVEFCGDIMFLNLNEANTVTLAESLGTFYNELENISLSLGTLVNVNTMEINANWKIVVENTLESYHVNMIHADTFKKLGAKGHNFIFEGRHSSWVADVELSRSDSKNNFINKNFKANKFTVEGYKHILIFPSLLVSTTHGNSFNFSKIEAISPSKTRFTNYVYLAKTSDQAKPVVLEAFGNSLAEFNKQVFQEDKDVCELVQRGVESSSYQGILSLEEHRVHEFQKNYYKLLNN